MTREEAIRDIEECVLPYVGGISLHMAIEALKEQRPHGKAIYKDFDEESGVQNSWWCSCCGFPLVQVYMSFCGNCGAELKKEGEAE